MNTANNLKETPKIGEGIYLSIDVAKILDIDPHKVRRLINGFWDCFSFGEDRTKAVNFFGLIEFYVYFKCREKGMPAQRIKKFHTQLSQNLNTKYPFAHFEIRTDFKNIWVKHFENYVKADSKLQFDLPPLLPKLERVSYGKNNIADKYFPLKKSENVVVDPLHQFGQPTINGTNIKTSTLYTLHKAGEPIRVIGNLYNISLKQVKDAIAFQKNAA